MKKLYGQFTEDEKEMINTILHGINTKSVRITFHAKSRMKEKDISFRDLFGIFTNYQIIFWWWKKAQTSMKLFQ